MLAWLQVLARKRATVVDLIHAHWRTYGRSVFTRYDYEDVDASGASLMMTYLEPLLPGFVGQELTANDARFRVARADNFEYTDPIDGSIAKAQGIRVFFEGGSRVVFRLSGTGAAGATIRVYVENYIDATNARLEAPAQDLLRPLVLVALKMCKLQQFTGRTTPTVIT